MTTAIIIISLASIALNVWTMRNLRRMARDRRRVAELTKRGRS